MAPGGGVSRGAGVGATSSLDMLIINKLQR